MNGFLFENASLVYIGIIITFLIILITLSIFGSKNFFSFIIFQISLAGFLLGLVIVHAECNKDVDINNEYYVTGGSGYKSLRLYKKDNIVAEQFFRAQGLNPNVKVKLISQLDCKSYSYEECLDKVKIVVSEL